MAGPGSMTRHWLLDSYCRHWRTISRCRRRRRRPWRLGHAPAAAAAAAAADDADDEPCGGVLVVCARQLAENGEMRSNEKKTKKMRPFLLFIALVASVMMACCCCCCGLLGCFGRRWPVANAEIDEDVGRASWPRHLSTIGRCVCVCVYQIFGEQRRQLSGFFLVFF